MIPYALVEDYLGRYEYMSLSSSCTGCPSSHLLTLRFTTQVGSASATVGSSDEHCQFDSSVIDKRSCCDCWILSVGLSIDLGSRGRWCFQGARLESAFMSSVILG